MRGAGRCEPVLARSAGSGTTDVRDAGRCGHAAAQLPWPSDASPRSASRSGASCACLPVCPPAEPCVGIAGEPSPGSGPPRYGSPKVCPLLVVSDVRAARRAFHSKPLKIVWDGAESQEAVDRLPAIGLMFTRRSRGTSCRGARATGRRATSFPPPGPSGPASP